MGVGVAGAGWRVRRGRAAIGSRVMPVAETRQSGRAFLVRVAGHDGNEMQLQVLAEGFGEQVRDKGWPQV